MLCEICNKEFKSYYALSAHIKSHDMNSKNYYDLYLKLPNEGICSNCNNYTRFVSISKGYKTTCSPRCSAIVSQTKREQTNLLRYGTKNPAQCTDIKQKISKTVKSDECQSRTRNTNLTRYGTEHPMQNTDVVSRIEHPTHTNCHITKSIESNQFEIDNDCTRIGKLINKYGQGWLSIKNNLDLIHYKGYTYVRNEQLHFIENYYSCQSKPEQELYDFVKNLCSDTLHKTRQIIKPFELDIYVPSLQLAIEYNSSWYHSVENGMSKDYHLNKSLLCRNKNIRLIHIYDFEDFEQQKQLLNDLILGIDNYPKNDFNKNNLIIYVPESVEYVSNRGYHIYTAGKLY